MHERSLVRALIEQVQDECRRHGLSRLQGVRMEVGAFSGVEPALIESAFREQAAKTWRESVGLQLEVVPLTAACRGCGATFVIERFRFVCPACGVTDLNVTGGEEVRLVSVTGERHTPFVDATP